MGKWTRRAFIGAGSLVGGGFVLGVAGVAFAPGRHSVVSADAIDKGELTTWITVTPDNFVTILIPHCEMGQGSQTGLAMMAAEEMEADWELVRIQEAPALDAYANAYMLRAFTGDSMPAPLGRAIDYGAYRLARWFGTQATGGSMAVRGTGYGMRIAGAAAREMLLAAGGRALRRPRRRVPRRPVRTSRTRRPGRVRPSASWRRRRRPIPAPSNPPFKDPRHLHHPAHVPAALRHSPEGQREPGLRHRLHAARHALRGGRHRARAGRAGWCRSTPAPAKAMPGVKEVVELEEAVAVVADSYWRARKALAALSPRYDDAGHGDVSSETIFAAFDEALGAAPEMPAEAAKVVTADYRVPFLAHATMEPMACHGARRRRPRRRVGGHAGSAERPFRRGQRPRLRHRTRST